MFSLFIKDPFTGYKSKWGNPSLETQGKNQQIDFFSSEHLLYSRCPSEGWGLNSFMLSTLWQVLSICFDCHSWPRSFSDYGRMLHQTVAINKCLKGWLCDYEHSCQNHLQEDGNACRPLGKGIWTHTLHTGRVCQKQNKNASHHELIGVSFHSLFCVH